jgi:hypothetical protein
VDGLRGSDPSIGSGSQVFFFHSYWNCSASSWQLKVNVVPVAFH